ncbi:MAG: hypothetical protein JRI72_11330 [Deltaproteobacteria bacterium]|nr:hypothetical protein [Deltaproteobacteria bacterium]
MVTTAESGLGKNFLPMADRLKAGKLTDCGQKALRQSEVVVTKDPLSSCTDCPLSDQYSGRGAMTIRLGYEGKIYGLLSTSIPIDFLSDKEEQSLFQEIAEDIAFALHNIELEEEHKQAEEELAKHREHLEELVRERTDELQKMVNLMAGREVRMAELKEVIQKLRAQLEGDIGLRILECRLRILGV